MWIFGDTVGLTVSGLRRALPQDPASFRGSQKLGSACLRPGLVIAVLRSTVAILLVAILLKMNPMHRFLVLVPVAGRSLLRFRAIQEEAYRANLPALGYTVPYAIGHIVLPHGVQSWCHDVVDHPREEPECSRTPGGKNSPGPESSKHT